MLFDDYEVAYYDDCINDLKASVDTLNHFDCLDAKTIEEIGITIQSIAKRLQKLEEKQK